MKSCLVSRHHPSAQGAAFGPLLHGWHHHSEPPHLHGRSPFQPPQQPMVVVTLAHRLPRPPVLPRHLLLLRLLHPQLRVGQRQEQDEHRHQVHLPTQIDTQTDRQTHTHTHSMIVICIFHTMINIRWAKKPGGFKSGGCFIEKQIYALFMYIRVCIF